VRVFIENLFKGVVPMKTFHRELSCTVLITGLMLLCGLLSSWPAQAGFTFNDPNIPDGEILTYTITTDGAVTDLVEKTGLKKQGDKEFYEINSTSPALDLVIRIERQNMAVLSVEQVKKHKEVTLVSKIDVIGQKPNPLATEIKLVHYTTLKYLLRGFPFAEGKKLRIGFYGESEKSRFSMSLTCIKKETIKVRQKPVACYHLELGLDGFFGAFFPNTHLWYSAEAPHRLVKLQGTNGPIGAPESLVELVEWTSPGK
jgi:hypothetical protein